MYQFSPDHGFSTLVTHYTESDHPLHAHVSPIYQTSTFNFPDVATGAAIVDHTQPGYYYTRLNNPNLEQFGRKLTLLEVIDLLREAPGRALDEVAIGQVFSSGMAAISTVLLAFLRAGDTVIAQEAVYSNTFNFFKEIAPRLEFNVIWVRDVSPEGWQAAFDAHPDARLVYAETPANPTMTVVDLSSLAEVTHRYNAWLVVDNTFATPYCQRPISLGADVVVHSTTKFLSGHGTVVGGAAISRHIDFMQQAMRHTAKVLGGVPSPFDAWLANLGLKTLELRMRQQCANAQATAQYLETQPAVALVHYPGLESHPGHSVAKRQMHSFGGMLSFELKGGFRAGVRLMENLKVGTLAVSLGNVDTLMQHPASMTHASVAREDRLNQGISDGLVRMSVGIENIEDILADLEQSLGSV